MFKTVGTRCLSTNLSKRPVKATPIKACLTSVPQCVQGFQNQSIAVEENADSTCASSLAEHCCSCHVLTQFSTHPVTQPCAAIQLLTIVKHDPGRHHVSATAPSGQTPVELTSVAFPASLQRIVAWRRFQSQIQKWGLWLHQNLSHQNH